MNKRLMLWTMFSTIFVLGCWGDGLESTRSGRISFSETNDGTIYFTNLCGELVSYKSNIDPKLIFKPPNGVLTDVDVSPDGMYLAVVEQPERDEQATQIILFTVDETDKWRELTRFDGVTPRFSSSGRSLLFAKPKRFVPRFGIGGGFWFDFQVHQYDLQSNDAELVADMSFEKLDDLAFDEAGAKIFVSVTASDKDNAVSENIVVLDSKTGESEQLSDCDHAQVCGGDPGLSPDSMRLVYVSDRQKEFHYWIYVEDLSTNSVQLLLKSTDYRFTSQPSYSRIKPGSILSLATSSFDSAGRPELNLVEFGNNSSSVLISTELFNRCFATENGVHR